MLAIIICTIILILIGAAIGIALGVSLNRSTGSFRWNPTGIVENSNTQLNGPEFVYPDGNQNIYVPDYYNYRIQRFPSGSLIGTTIAGTGTPGNATNQFNGIKNIWLDSSYQYLYEVESLNNRVMRFSTNSINGTAGTVVAGGNNPGNNTDQLNNPQGIYYDTSSNSMYIANYGGHTIIKWIPGASNGSVAAGTSGESGNTSSLLNSPLDVRVDQYQNIYVADSRNFRIQRFCVKNGNQGTTIAGGNGAGNSSIHLAQPRSLHFDSQMNLYVSDTTNHRIIKFVKV
ncbi:unnamed protein product [Rotaria sp. Silwood1]|nr:unnamed protein product [Rotaria sp. Silwood1]CAF1552199.1 unnamed protein product [Rotaria sp. Silwood1]CAF3613134.1 unnamed protein product [Rotaria sp. Silwood1]CAF3740938.1 unnamed protein product [Rotaria sp. Silwood1]